jgi:Phosphotransferase enzyme family
VGASSGDDSAVRAAAVSEAAEVFGAEAVRGGVTVEPLGHVAVASATAAIDRVRCGGRSAVVKVLAPSSPGHAKWTAGADEAHWYYWRREAEAYASGLLGTLAGGLRAPDCALVADRPDGSVALWLEDLDGAPASAWPLDRYRLAARHLGAAQGEFAAGRPLPADAWLSRAWLPAYLRQRDGDMPLLEDPGAWRHPALASWERRPAPAALVALRADQARFLHVLDRLPPTLAHLDLHPANMFEGGGGTTAVIDWAFVGVGALGEDAGNLVPDAVLDFHVPPDRIDDLHAAAVDGYEEGLRSAGWAGPSALVRLALAAAMAAKFAWIPPAILRAAVERRAHLNRRPIAEALPAWAATVDFLLARAAEARRLMTDAGVRAALRPGG